MQKSMKLLLRISCFLVLVLTSCATNTVVKDYKTVALEKSAYNVPYFSNPTIDYVYKANITVYGNELTGIFIAKKINDTTHRVVFTTEFGNKLLDFEISETNFKVNSIVEELDRKMLINTLIIDFRLLLRSHYAIKNQFDNKENEVYLSEEGKRLNYLFVSKSDSDLSKIVHSTKRKEKIILFFTSENNIFASKIIIQHKTIPLKIELNYFNEQSK
jgi:phosphoribosylformylglycinamidine (FGAM) synthase PurS component